MRRPRTCGCGRYGPAGEGRRHGRSCRPSIAAPPPPAHPSPRQPRRSAGELRPMPYSAPRHGSGPGPAASCRRGKDKSRDRGPADSRNRIGRMPWRRRGADPPAQRLRRPPLRPARPAGPGSRAALRHRWPPWNRNGSKAPRGYSPRPRRWPASWHRRAPRPRTPVARPPGSARASARPLPGAVPAAGCSCPPSSPIVRLTKILTLFE
jgi:hypothetical protein